MTSWLCVAQYIEPVVAGLDPLRDGSCGAIVRLTVTRGVVAVFSTQTLRLGKIRDFF